MKTQIITLAAHDDLISVRDRMSWAKSPRILLVWPAHEQIALRPLDLRILQQHAGELGAQLGLVSRQSGIRRDAAAFGIPAFRSTQEAQREPWSGRSRRRSSRLLRRHERRSQLRAMKDQLRRERWRLDSLPAARIGFFALGVLAVFSLVSLFVPRARVVLTAVGTAQAASIPFQVNPVTASGVVMGAVPAHTASIIVSGSQTSRVESMMEVPKDKARGVAQFRNLVPNVHVLPAGTVVYSLTPASVRFATLEEAELEGEIGALVDIPIEALEAGAVGNLPANAIQGIEGTLGASVSVHNPRPTEGGLEAMESVPSAQDRDELRDRLLGDLKTQAEAGLAELITEEDVLLPGTLTLGLIEQETYDPPAGQPASVLNLAMSVKYEIAYAKKADLRRLAEATLDASTPSEYAARPESLDYRVVSAGDPAAEEKPAFILEATRTIARRIDAYAVNQLIRGKAPVWAVTSLQSTLPLAAPPEIRLTPAWWPWMPLIPFRIDVVIS